ncbi:MAG: FAD-binding oxidoreductase [Roseibium sp.]|uniref:NAD(P)/FAD-dependent oxidoreductase n=1 Tax=Roseibium sp. TaxID=1936156 RepID=UPI00261688AC|nr:FAD-dependent oxidoreductase [Roseibium sp.]MCV0429194.1 FAD-binding oxidoreductase [Roseibium sp.]
MEDKVTILGAGAVGICTALSLAERGVPVRLIDRAEPGQETTFGNAGVISPWSFIPQSLPGTWKKLPNLLLGKYRPLSVQGSYWAKMVPWGLTFLKNGAAQRVEEISNAMEPLCAPSVDLYRRHLSGTGAENLIRDSVYVHAFRNNNRDVLEAIDYRIRREKGGTLELVGEDDLRRIEPAVSSEFKAAVIIHDQARAVAPGRVAAVLAEKAARLGVEIVRDQVNSLKRQNDLWRIEGDANHYSAKSVVVAMGAWSAELLKSLGISVPLAAERGYHVEFPDPGITLNHSVMDMDAKFVASSMSEGLRVAGYAEFADVDAPRDERKQSRITAQAKAAFPDLNDTRSSFWMGRRPSFPDSLPMIGEFTGHSGLYAGFGHSHYGLMMAPKTGELLADFLTNRNPNLDCTPYRTDRFSKGRPVRQEYS